MNFRRGWTIAVTKPGRSLKRRLLRVRVQTQTRLFWTACCCPALGLMAHSARSGSWSPYCLIPTLQRSRERHLGSVRQSCGVGRDPALRYKQHDLPTQHALNPGEISWLLTLPTLKEKKKSTAKKKKILKLWRNLKFNSLEYETQTQNN